MPPLPWNFGPSLDSDLVARAESQLSAVARTIRMATALTTSGRHVDLTGLDQQVGVLCAQTLDLGRELASNLRPKLAGLLTDLDHLAQLQTIAPQNFGPQSFR